MPCDRHSVASYLTEHIDALSGVERKTMAEYQRYLSCDIEPTLGHIPLTTLNRTDISRGSTRCGMRARRERPVSDQDDYQLLRAGFTDRWHPLLDFLVSSGCRFSESHRNDPG